MYLATLCVLALLRAGVGYAQDTNVTSTCQQIAIAVSSASFVYYPRTAEDVGIILQILGANQAPFAVKGGGHAMNPGYSSTTGVQISMTRFNSVVYDASTSTAAIGAGLTWDKVYSALEQYDVNVVGGRVTGIGVAGFTLGGGYSWLTNQYGLTLDNVRTFELALPNGTVTNVTESSNPDLFFGLKGGYNNFGIVTTFTFQTYPQGQVWGGQITYPSSSVNNVSAATATFSSNVTDPKAAIITTYDYTGGLILASVIIFYDAPNPPSGIFDDFLSIPALATNVKTRSFLSLVQVETTQETANFRGYYNTVPLTEITEGILNDVLTEAQYWGEQLQLDSDQIISYDVEPFLPTILTHGGPSAYPWTRTERYLPLNIYFSWSDETYDSDYYAAITQTATNLTSAAVAEGQTNISGVPHYPNYSLYGTPISDIWGTALPTLVELKQTYDPNNVMGLAGGWKVPT
ncbi:hypothetical protein POSPLADRAFT_1182032 [Postia placenta MAD-698-R-SB12]|uniref:FAD-binding PCMH-type domain-containing protein n=1 Tax=Postia placenta MAD-698-R-SB12 TaxID=670580 RepID=A0A1X6MX71_9APHY|nr:hypothetical protein POSPLADRAFT_1182032 [Postia placenta MAD-698-R-SB12]OSX60836.1 hypothetical protein POSPLADRAFT_1182032 [Postia placenta MAD-698-R-SB12]